MHLHRAVDHVVQHARRVELDQRDLDARLVALVDLVRGVERHQPARLDLGGRVGDPVLHRLLVGERAAEGLALERVRAHELERALHLAEPAHDVVDATRAEPLLRDPEAVALLAERVLDGDADARVAHLAVRRPAAAAVAHGRDRADDLDARRVGRDDDLGRAAVRVGVGVGDGHDDPEGGPLGPRREPLVAVDHPLVAVPHCARPQSRRIRAGHLGLGHREERAHLAGDERPQPALLLLVGAEQPEDLGVARVGRLAAEDELTPDRAADLLVQVRVDEEAPARAARLGRHVRRPETLLLRSGAQTLDERVGLVVLAVQRGLVRIDVLLHERAVAGTELDDLVGRAEVGDGHGVSIARDEARLLHGVRPAGHEPARADRDRAGGGAARLRLRVGRRGLGNGLRHRPLVARRDDGADQARQRDHADPRPHAVEHGDDGGDARPALRRALPPRARDVGAAGRRGLARPAVGQAAREDARVRRDRARRAAARRSSSTTGRTTTSR